MASATSTAVGGSIGNRYDGGIPAWVWGVGLGLVLLVVILFIRPRKN